MGFPDKTVTIYYHVEPDGWWADSPDIPGWTCVGSTFDEVRALSLEGAREFIDQGVAIVEALPVTEATSGVFGEVLGGTLTFEHQVSLNFSASTLPGVRASAPAPRVLDSQEFAFHLEAKAS